MSDWSAHGASGDPLTTSDGLPLAIGPCVVTADEIDPQTMIVQVTIDGEELAKGNLNGAAESLYTLISEASRIATLERGDAFALGPFGNADLDRPGVCGPGANRARGEGIGTLRNRLSPAENRWKRRRRALMPARSTTSCGSRSVWDKMLRTVVVYALITC